MRILGLDPGVARTGFGAVEYRHGQLHLLKYGVVTTTPKLEMSQRLLQINRELSELIDTIEPDAVAIEQIYYHKNAKTVIMVAQSRGVALLTSAQAGRPIAEYTPLQVKQAVVGYGKADKRQVQYMVQKLLHLKDTPKPDDAADALATAICHAHFYQLAGLYREQHNPTK